MLGSGFEAEDAVQEAFLRAGELRAVRGLRRCARGCTASDERLLDMLGGRERRARPMELAPARSADNRCPSAAENVWILPVPDDRVVPQSGDPSEVLEARESVRLAFVAALQHLPPRQRAVLILREVLRWKASEVAELLDTSVASVNSALQRARATLESLEIEDAETLLPTDDEQRALLDRYVDAFERYDMESLTSLLREDATWSMPPYEMWLQTHDDIRAWCLGPGIGCRGSKLISLEANGMRRSGIHRARRSATSRGHCSPGVADGRIRDQLFLDRAPFPHSGSPTPSTVRNHRAADGQEPLAAPSASAASPPRGLRSSPGDRGAGRSAGAERARRSWSRPVRRVRPRRTRPARRHSPGGASARVRTSRGCRRAGPGRS